MAETEDAGRFQSGVEGARWLQAKEHDAAQGDQMRLQDPETEGARWLWAPIEEVWWL